MFRDCDLGFLKTDRVLLSGMLDRLIATAAIQAIYDVATIITGDYAHQPIDFGIAVVDLAA